MAVNRIDRVNALLKRVIAEAVFRVFQADDVNPGTITVTSVNTGRDLRNATVNVSVFGTEEEQKRALGHLVHHTREFERIVNREVRLKYTPVLRFVLDHSLEKGDRVLALLNSLEPAADASAEAPAASEV